MSQHISRQHTLYCYNHLDVIGIFQVIYTTTPIGTLDVLVNSALH